MWASINSGQPKQEELLIDDTSQRSPETFDFRVERLCCCIGGTLVVEIEYVTVMLLERPGDYLEVGYSRPFHFIIPACQVEHGSGFCGGFGEVHPQ